MATSVFHQRVLRLHYLSRLQKSLILARCQHRKAEQDVDDLGETDEASQPVEEGPQLAYKLFYSPSSYCHIRNVQTVLSQRDNEEDEPCLPILTPCFWQQGNTYSVSSSRHLSSTKNTLLDLAFNKSPEMQSQARRQPIPPDIRFDTRAFLKCRPEYSCISLNTTQRPSPTSLDKSWGLLKKVTVLKGALKPSDVSSILWELSSVDPDKTTLVRSDQRFVMLLRYSVENLQLYSLSELLEVLQAFVWLDMPSAHSVLALYESELSRRVDQMTLHQFLFAADLWRCIGKQVPQYLKSVYASVPLYIGQIRTPELVQLLYIMGEGRYCPKELVQPLEQLLMRHLHELQPEEVGTVCLGLFKSQTSLSEGAVMRILDKAHVFVEDMSDFGLVNVMKYLRFSYLYHKEWLDAMGKEVPRRAHRMGIQGLMHMALACSALHYRNDNILTAIAERVPLMVPHCRSKDSCKLLWAYGTLGFLPVKSPSLYPSLTEALRQRKAEFYRYPEHLLTGLLGLAFVSTFPEDLISLALSPEFVKLALKSTQLDLKKDLYTLNGAVELELPHWTGPRLTSDLQEEVADMLWKFAESDICQKQEVVQAELCLKDLLGGEEFVCKRMILPYTRSIDLEVHLDSKGQPIPVTPPCNTTPEKTSSKSENFYNWDKVNIGVKVTDDLVAQLLNTKNKKSSLKVVKPTLLHSVEPDEGDLFNTGLFLTNEVTDMLTKSSVCNENKGPVKLAIQVCNRNHYCYHSDQLLGLHAMKRRHLKLIGYKVVDLNHQEWFPLLRKSRTEKLAYLHCKVFNQ
ncbi:FAST kinase domain-containing protein 5, mitochondrial [Periophthalmus magnuspinnatus]|uniref:FAST kinase domain-containing protein 5, mitochondrial n=1 Tax=Periophthalmus magnuspinnatus TaxID=409849 RepID=UPI00145B3088|nr:FAST kinase domain-containing protein 5, mitochondrial [Periophthalmus magnuspinnatus]